MTFLAAVTTATGLGNTSEFLSCVFYLAGGVLVLVKLWDRFTDRKSPDALKQPIKVQKHENLVSSEDFERFRAQSIKDKEEVIAEMVERFERLQQARSTTAAGIYQRIEDTGQALRSDIAMQMQGLSSSTQALLKEIGNRLNNHGERIAALEAIVKKGRS